MDPDANIQEITRILGRMSDDQDRLTELLEALENWLQHGGFQPDWSNQEGVLEFYLNWRKLGCI